MRRMKSTPIWESPLLQNFKSSPLLIVNVDSTPYLLHLCVIQTPVKFSASSVWSMDGRTKHPGAGAGGPGRVLENPSSFARRQLLSVKMQTIIPTTLIERSNVPDEFEKIPAKIGSKGNLQRFHHEPNTTSKGKKPRIQLTAL